MTGVIFNKRVNRWKTYKFLRQNIWQLMLAALALLSRPAVSDTPWVQSGAQLLTIGGGKFAVQYIKADIHRSRFVVAVAKDCVGCTEELSTIAAQHDAVAAVNGCFFEAYTSAAYKRPDLTLIHDGKRLFNGVWGTMMGIGPHNEIRMALERDVSNQLFTTAPYWGQVREAISCGPRLLTDGQITVNPRDEGFSEAKILSLSCARSAVGITADGWMLLITTRGTIRQLAQVMQALGAVQAMNLDGGASSGLWLRGKYLVKPGRLISNALLVCDRADTGGTETVAASTDNTPRVNTEKIAVKPAPVIAGTTIMPQVKPELITAKTATVTVLPQNFAVSTEKNTFSQNECWKAILSSGNAFCSSFYRDGDAMLSATVTGWGPHGELRKMAPSPLVLKGDARSEATFPAEKEVTVVQRIKNNNPRSVYLQYTITAAADTPLSALVVDMGMKSAFQNGVVVLNQPDGRQLVRSLALSKPELLPEMSGISLRPRAGGEVTLFIDPPCPLRIANGLQVVLAQNMLPQGTRVVTLTLRVNGQLSMFVLN